jgi:hypothetical protein
MCALDELFAWIQTQDIQPEQIYLNILNHPECMNIRSLPEELKQLATARLNDWRFIPKVEDTIKYMWSEDWHERRWPEFLAFNAKTDELQRGGNLTTVCPEFIKYV